MGIPLSAGDSELAATLTGGNLAGFVSYRSEKGPFADLGAYAAFFDSGALASLYCAHSFMNVNTADEIMLQTVVERRTGDSALAARVRARIRAARIARQVLTEGDIASMLGTAAREVGDLLSAAPELDVNSAPVEVLRAILTDPDCGVDEPGRKLELLLRGRLEKPWTSGTLREALAAKPDATVLQYLGTTCRFIEVGTGDATGSLSAVVLLSYSGDTPSKVACRVIETREGRK